LILNFIIPGCYKLILEIPFAAAMRGSAAAVVAAEYPQKWYLKPDMSFKFEILPTISIQPPSLRDNTILPHN
jgi:hypothetical protein